MAYGKGGGKDSDKRMVDLGRSATSADLARLRLLCIDACGVLAKSAWPESILDAVPSGRELDAKMLLAQARLKGTLNSVWAEKSRLSAKATTREQWKRAQRTLFGRFKHIGTVGDVPMKDGIRRILNLPEEWSLALSDADVSALQQHADTLNFVGMIEMFRKLRSGGAIAGLSKLQCDALRAMLAGIEERFGIPEWKTDESVVQLHIDFRCMVGGRTAQDALLKNLKDAVGPLLRLDEKEKEAQPIRSTFLVSGIVARSAPLKLDVTMRADILKRLMPHSGRVPQFTSMVLEIGPKEAVVKGVLSLAPAPIDWSKITHLVGGDTGFVNTQALSVVKIDRPIDPQWMASTLEWTKKQAREYLETHCHPGQAVEELLLDGADFLGRIKRHAEQIDRYRSEIDCIYNRIGRIKVALNRAVGQPDNTRIDLAMRTNCQRVASMLRKLNYLLPQVAHLKALRRGAYRTVEGLKKSWFGFVSSEIARLCTKWNAAWIREDFCFLPKEKLRPDYKGRTFNKMVNNGATGQFLRRTVDKLKWHGIPQAAIPTYYTSTTDVRHAVVDKKQRNGEVFRAKVDGAKWHADLHASLTIALYPLLRPLVGTGIAT